MAIQQKVKFIFFIGSDAKPRYYVAETTNTVKPRVKDELIEEEVYTLIKEGVHVTIVPSKSTYSPN